MTDYLILCTTEVEDLYPNILHEEGLILEVIKQFLSKKIICLSTINLSSSSLEGLQ